ncbi:hypothetical protein BGX21_005005, partial [Mortierella sp. AD011]
MSSPSPSLQSSSEESLPSANKLFEEQASYILARNTLPYEDLLKSFQSRYRLQNSGALSDAIIKSAKRIINRQPNTDTKEWAETLIINTKWCKSQKPNPPSNAVSRAGRQHIKQVIGEVSQSFSSITNAIGESGRSQALGSHSPSTPDTSIELVSGIDLFDQPITSSKDDQSSSEHYITEGSKKQKLNSGQAIPAHDDYIHYEEMLNEGAHTPPHKVTVDSEIPKVSDMAAMFHHVDATGNNDGTEHLSETNLKLLESATFWYKKLTAKGIDQAIMSMREDRYPIAWIHDLIYDRLKLLRKGGLSNWDENTYTSFWVNLDLMALYTRVDDLITLAYANENHFSPSAWRRSLARDHPHSKGTSVDGFYSGKDGMIDIIVENVGAPSSSNYAKKLEDER